jgi:predicted dehydrogenase
MTRLGFAGLGWLGESLIKDVPRIPGLEVVAVQDVAPGRAEAIAAMYDARCWFERFDDLAASSMLDALVISTPNGLHAEQAQRALAAGKDVLVQKPLALTHRDAVQTLAMAARARRLLFVDYTYRFLPSMRIFREALATHGEPRAVRAAFHNVYGPGAEKRWFFDAAQSGGGALTDLGVHLIDLGLWLVSPSRVTLEHVALGEATPVEYAAQLQLRLDEVPLELAVSWNAPLPATEIVFEIDTPSGRLRWENVEGSFFHFRTSRDGEVLLDRETTLREDTLRAFASALADRVGSASDGALAVDARVYELLDRAYGRS